MLIRKMSDDWGGNGLEEGEKRAQSTTEEDNIIARIDGSGEGRLVGIEVAQDMGEDSLGVLLGGIRGGFGVAVELEEPGEQRQDEGKGYLWRYVSWKS